MPVIITYIIEGDVTGLTQQFPGVANKVNGQISCFKNAGFDCELQFASKTGGRLRKIWRRIPFYRDCVNWHQLLDDDRLFTSKCIYIRRPGYISREFIRFLRLIKRNNKILIILEVPTYPYDSEYLSAAMLPLLVKDRIHRRFLAKYVDKVAVPGPFDEVFGVETLSLINGIDLSPIAARAPSLSPDEPINIMCAASFSRWHGVDRFISGLSEYVSRSSGRSVRLHLLGDGPALPGLKKQVSDLKLDDYVTFYGQCDKGQMDEVYDGCTLAIASLGLHRIGLSVASTLKTREYLAKGIPFVYSGKIDVFERGPVDFCLEVPADETPVDFEKVVAFHDRLYSVRQEELLIRDIRRYAEDHVSMDAAMRPVVDYIKEALGE